MPDFDKDLNPILRNVDPVTQKLDNRRVAESFPRVPSLSGNPASATDEFFGSGPKVNPMPGTISVKDINANTRYGIYDPSIIDIEDQKAYAQSATDKAVNGILKGVNLAATTVAGGFGMLYGAMKMPFTGKFSDLWNNEVMHKLDNWNNRVDQELLPNYYTDVEKNAAWYSTDNWFTANFLFDKLIKNSGFAVGAMVSGNIANAGLMRLGTALGEFTAGEMAIGSAMAESKQAMGLYGKYLKNISRAFSAGKNAEAAAILEDGISSIADLGAKSAKLGQLAEETNAFFKINDVGRRAAVAAYSSAGEASFEAIQTGNELKANLIAEYKNNNGGANPQGDALRKIEDYVANAGRMSFLGNMALLGVTEYVQLPYLIGSSYKSSRQAANSLMGKIAQTVEQDGVHIMAKPTTKFGKLYDKATGIGKYIFDPKEATQEGLQFALQTGTTDYYNKAYKSKGAESLLDSFMYGLSETVNSKEGMESMLLGGLTGGPMQARQNFIESRGIENNTQKFLSSINNAPSFRAAFVDRMKSLNRAITLQEQQQDAVVQNDQLEAKDLDADLMHNYLSERIKYGRFDMVMEDLTDLKRTGMTEGGLYTLKEEGIANVNDTVESFLNRVNTLEKVAKATNEMYKALDLRYSGILTKDGKRMYSPELIDMMAYATSKISNYDLRIPQVNQALVDYNIPTMDVLQSIIKDGKPNVKATKEALDQINDLDVTEEVKDELKTSLSDVIEMSLRRKLFMKEYSDMKNNPQDYEVPNEDIDVQTATVKQTLPPDEEGGKRKTVNKELEVGKEYSLSEPLRRDGNSLTLAPKLRILSKTLGGEYEVELPTGQISFLKPEDFKQFNIIEGDNASAEIEKMVSDAAIEAIQSAYPEVDLTDQDPLAVLSSLNDEELVSSVMNTVDEKVKSYKEKQEKIAQELAEMAENEKLDVEITQTYDASEPILDDEEKTPGQGDARKSDAAVLTGTISSPNIPGYENSNELGFNLETLPNRDELVGVYINSKNEGLLIPGLTQHLKDAGDPQFTGDIDPAQTVVLVVVKKDKNGYTLVGKDGQPLGPGANPLTDAVYQVKPLAGLEWSREYTPGQGKSMFRQGTDPVVVASYTEQYNAERERILALTTLEDHSIEASFGVPVPVPILDDEGKEIKGATGKNSVSNAGLVSEEELETGEPVITIPTSDDTLIGGTTSFNNPKGKAFIKVGKNYVKLNNNKISSSQANVIYSVLVKFAENARKNKSIKKGDSPKLANFLKSILYWGTPQEGKSPGRNSMWIGDGKLNIGRSGVSIPFTATSIQNNKQLILDELSNMYHNINSTLAKDVSTPYSEITGIDSNGKISEKKWPNYQSYLLSSKGRENDDIPATVNLKSGVNRKGIYFMTPNEIDKFAAPVPVVKPKVLAPVSVEGKPAVEKSAQVLDGKTKNTMTIQGRGTIEYTADGVMLQSKDLMGIRIDKTPENKAFIQALADEKGISVPEAVKSIKGAIFNNIANEIENYTKEAPKGFFKSTGKSAPIAPAPVTKEETKKQDDEIEFDITDDDDIQMDIQMSEEEDDEVLRAVVEETAKRFERENWTKLEDFFKKAFPNVPVYRVKNMITATNGMQAWGMLKDGAIYLYKNAEVGTAYHEVFEAVWKMFTDADERSAILQEFKNRSGEFLDRPTGQTVKYSEATPEQAKEQLAEEFRDYVLNPKKQEGSKVVKFFKDLVNFIKEFFVGPSAETNTQQLFEKITTGYYKNYAPYHSSLAFAKEGIIDIEDVYATEDSEFSIANFTGAEQHDIIQQMLYLTLRDIVATNKSLFRVDSDIKKADTLAMLKDQLQKTVLKSRKAAEKSVKEGTLTQDEADPIITKSKVMWKSINNEENWNNIVSKFEEKLRTYGIEFDENDNVAKTDENNSGRETYMDASKIDQFKKANPAIKLLLSTLPIMKYDVNAKKNVPVNSSINGVNLLPTSQAFMAIMNRVSSSRNLNEMMEKLRTLANEDPNYEVLYKRLTKNKDISQPADLSKLNNTHDIQLVSAFWRSFKKNSPDVKNVFILENGDIVVGDSNFTTAANQVREEFLNQIRKVVQAPNNKYFIYNKQEKVYKGKSSGVKGITFNAQTEREQIELMTNFLKEFGIDFAPSDILSARVSSKDREVFKEAVIGFRDSINTNKSIMKLTGKALAISGRLRELAEIKAKLDNPEFSSTYFNVNGERTQTFIGTNAATDLHDMLSQVDNINDLRGTQYEYLLTDSFAKNSIILKKMFDANGKRKQIANTLFKVGYVDGTVNSVNGKKKQSSKLTYKERLSQEINLNLAGYYLNLIPGDSSLEWMLNIENTVKEFDQVFDIFKGYFVDELNLAREDRPVAEDRVSTDMRFFKAILGDGLHNKLISQEGTAEEIYDNNKEEIDEAVGNFIRNTSESLNETLKDYSILKENLDGTYTVEGLNLEQKKNISKDELDQQMLVLNANYMISNIEMHKLLYSDPYQYSDELKRIKNFNSPRQAVIHSTPSLNAAMNRVWNRGFKKDDAGYTDFRQDYFKTITLADAKAANDLPGYNNITETDGGGIISIKASRNFRIRSGEWTDANEKQYRYDVAWYKNHKDLPLTSEEDRLLSEGNPEVKSTYTPLKPIVSGNKANGKPYNDVMLDKFSLYPLSYRVVYETNPTANALDLYDKMENEKIDYGVFESGRKVGAEKTTQLYKDGKLNDAPFEGIINVPFAIMSIQSEVPSKDESLITRGSQITKLVTMDFMEAGVPVTFMKGQDFAKRYEAWINLSDDEKMKNPLYKEIKDNQKWLELTMENGFNVFLKKLGIKKTNTGYELSDVTKVKETLKQEILKREVNDNIIDALEGYENGNVVLEATPAYQQIRNILYSIADKNVISPKINGGMKVQIPSTLLESERIVREDGKLTSDVLKFYEDEDGKRYCEIMVGRWFESNKTDAELINYFNNTKEGQKELAAITGVAFRIPTQKQNSIEAFKIAKFLPKEFGDSVVVPSALVVKAGSDFDIDKLNIYFKNVYSDRNGDIKMFEYKGSEEATKEFYGEVFDQLSQSDEAYIEKQLAQLSLAEEIDVEAEEALITKQEKLADRKERFIERAYKSALENAYIQSTQNLVEHEENFSRLIEPNSADQLKNLATTITSKLRSEKFNYSNVGNILNRRFMSRLRHAFVTGKYAIGIAAVNQTNHSLNQRQAMYIDSDRIKNLPLTDREWLGDGKIKFDKYNKITINGKTVPTLSMIKNTVNQDISNILGQFIDGYVDIAKGPWIMELGATPNVASTWMFLVKIGVPINTVAYFMNQPIIRDYLRAVENAGYSWLFIDDIVDQVSSSEKYKVDKKKVDGVSSIPSAASLLETVGKKNLSEIEKANQVFMLNEFLKYAKMGQQMFNLTQGSNFDTATFNDPFLVFKKGEQLKVAQRGLIASVDDLLDNSFIGDLYGNILEIREALAQVLGSDQPNVRRVIEKTLMDQLDNSDRDFVKIAQKAVNDLFDWAVQVDRGINSNLINTFINGDGNVSSPRKVLEFVEKVKADPNHPLYNNQVIKLIDVKLSETDGGIDNVSIKNKDNKVYDQNNIIYAFEEIKEYMKGTGEDIYKELVKLAVVQSGLTNSPISYTQLIPYEDFKKAYNKTLSKINNLENLDDFYKLNVFARNNWNNDDVVPTRVGKKSENAEGILVYKNLQFSGAIKQAMVSGKIPQLLKLGSKAREANKDSLTFRWGTNKALFTKVKDETGEPLTITMNIRGEVVTQYVYKMINAWGDGYKVNEFYPGSRPSVFDNGYNKVEYTQEETAYGIQYTSNEVSDSTIISYFKPGKAPQKVKSVEAVEEGTYKLKDGKNYKREEITEELLRSLGYKSNEINKELEKLCNT